MIARRTQRALALVAAAGALIAGGLTTATSASVGSLSASADVEMLGSEDGSDVVTMAGLLADTFPWAPYLDRRGDGVDVALIDTGVAPVDGLDGADKVWHGPDLSFEGADKEVAYLDTYGHGTHMAGIIAGDREGAEGVAPEARIISIKTAGHDGRTTVPQVVAAIDWVVDHRNSDGLNIRVLNLSLGQSGVSSHRGDLLSAAVERAWRAGIAVVVAAGNDGESQLHLDSPAIDPYVIAVGTVDSTTANTWNKWARKVPAWSASGDGVRNPDVVSPGRSVASYRVPGSTIDTTYPNARYDENFFLGSGTSQAAAVTSGIAAFLISNYPWLTPDQVKQTIQGRALPLNTASMTKQGRGHVDGSATVGNWPIDYLAPQWYQKAAGWGTGIVAPTGATWTGGEWSGATWTGATWTGATWTGATWTGNGWAN